MSQRRRYFVEDESEKEEEIQDKMEEEKSRVKEKKDVKIPR